MGPKRKATLRAKREARRAEAQRQLAALAETGARCATCEHCRPYPHGPKLTCDLDSDFHGYAIVDPDDLCLRFKTKGDTP